MRLISVLFVTIGIVLFTLQDGKIMSEKHPPAWANYSPFSIFNTGINRFQYLIRFYNLLAHTYILI